MSNSSIWSPRLSVIPMYSFCNLYAIWFHQKFSKLVWLSYYFNLTGLKVKYISSRGLFRSQTRLTLFTPFVNQQKWEKKDLCWFWISLFWLSKLFVTMIILYTRRKNEQLVTNLQQTCSNVVPTRLVIKRYVPCSHFLFPACWQVVNGLLTTCYKVVELNRLVTSCSNNLLSSCNSTICRQVVSDNLVATW